MPGSNPGSGLSSTFFNQKKTCVFHEFILFKRNMVNNKETREKNGITQRFFSERGLFSPGIVVSLNAEKPFRVGDQVGYELYFFVVYVHIGLYDLDHIDTRGYVSYHVF